MDMLSLIEEEPKDFTSYIRSGLGLPANPEVPTFTQVGFDGRNENVAGFLGVPIDISLCLTANGYRAIAFKPNNRWIWPIPIQEGPGSPSLANADHGISGAKINSKANLRHLSVLRGSPIPSQFPRFDEVD
jgi:hypothetical protein